MVILSSFKTDITKVGLVFLISNFFVNKTVQGRNWFAIFLKKLALKSVKSCLFSSREWYSPHLPVRSVLGQDSLSMPPYQTCPFPAGPPYQVVFIYSGKSWHGKRLLFASSKMFCYWLWKHFCHFHTPRQCLPHSSDKS